MLFVTSGRFDVFNSGSCKQQNNIHGAAVNSPEKKGKHAFDEDINN